MKSRRHVIKTLSATIGGALLYNPLSAFHQDSNNQEIGCQEYTWSTYFQREGAKWDASSDIALKALKGAGFSSFEPTFQGVDQVSSIAHLVSGGIKIHSFYVNSTLHDQKLAEKSIDDALAIAKEAKRFGAKIVVTNPTPIKWGGSETKTDEELKFQARMLDQLGKKLRENQMTLAYHTHDAEMKRGAREFHHMMLNTAPENVSMCLDAHWIFRGTEDSQVALIDVIKLYNKRIVELHLRQSNGGIWSETFDQGDIDYGKVIETLKNYNVNPYLVVEQAPEKGTPHTMGAVEAIGKSLNYTKKLFY